MGGANGSASGDAMTNPRAPIGRDELEGLFGPVLDGRTTHRAALAVSGGSDSTALMLLFADWLSARQLPASDCTILTVDHGLRSRARAEAHWVAARARAHGFGHAVLVWQGPKPVTGIQAAARAERYRLMAEYCQAHGLDVLLTAHTADDQAETLFMRLARGSGLLGLSAMMVVRDLHDPETGRPPIKVVRPLLETAKSRLRATLEQRGVTWIDDLSNQDRAFERVRLRAAQPTLHALGLTADRLALSIRRLQRAHWALERTVADFCAPAAGHVVIGPCGDIAIDRAALRAVADEIAIRALARAILAAGGSAQPVALAKLEEIAAVLATPVPAAAWTLARAKITATVGHVLVEREPGRVALPQLVLAPGETRIWDRRFQVAAAPPMMAPVEVRALGAQGLGRLRNSMAAQPRGPTSALRSIPAFWSGAILLAAPCLRFWATPEAQAGLSAVFIAPGHYNQAPSWE
jgi:tRNA(Ile)-lysidine synthase